MTMLIVLAMLAAPPPAASPAPRGRDLGIPFDFGTPGPAQRDHRRPRRGGRARDPRRGRRRAHRGHGGAAARARRRRRGSPCFAGYYSLNGNGEMTGIAWLEEAGVLEGPVLITNTNAVGVIRDAVIQYAHQRWGAREGWSDAIWSLPVVAETWDGTPQRHLRRARQGRARAAGHRGRAPGAGGRGRGRRRHGDDLLRVQGRHRHRRRACSPATDGGYTVGVLVQANFGLRHQLRIAGLPVGPEMRDDLVLDGGDGLHHHRGGHRRAAAAAPG